MPELVITCARCQRQLRVPDEMQGRLVKCPACEFAFTVQRDEALIPLDLARASAPSVADGRQPEARPRPSPEELVEGDRYRLRPSVVAPAVCLLLVSILAVLGSGIQLAMMRLQGEEEMRKERIQLMKKLFEMLDPKGVPPQVELEQGADQSTLVSKIVNYGGITVGLITLLSAVQMLRLRTYGFAVTGSILAMINLGCCSCLLGFPFGIWALVILLRPEIKNIFYS
jgi:hypothetical protein